MLEDVNKPSDPGVAKDVEVLNVGPEESNNCAVFVMMGGKYSVKVPLKSGFFAGAAFALFLVVLLLI
jgi:hypothetical protein